MTPRVEASLKRLYRLREHPMPQFRDAIIAELCALTGSEIAYFYASNLQEDRLTLLGYSKSVMDSCQIVDRPAVYKVDETGLWGDAVRERRPVITNDYQNSSRPSKRGYPKGHVEVRSHMNLPIIVNDHIVAIVGVGNKATDYTLADAEDVEELMLGVWHEFEEALWAAVW